MRKQINLIFWCCKVLTICTSRKIKMFYRIEMSESKWNSGSANMWPVKKYKFLKNYIFLFLVYVNDFWDLMWDVYKGSR